MSNTNVSLVKISQEVIGSNEQLAKFRENLKGVANLVFPETYHFDQESARKVTASIITFSTEVDGYGNNKDIYKTDSGNYALHYSALNRIAQAANLIVTDSRILERQVDDSNRVVLISHQIKWKIRGIDGGMKEGVATGKYDYYRDLASYINKKDGTPMMSMVNARRKHAEALAESNAMTRAISQAIAELPRGLTLEDLKKPFIVPCIIEDKNALLEGLPEEDKIMLKKMRAAKALGIADQIFPSARQIEAPSASPKVDPTQPSSEPPAENAGIQDAQFTTISDNGPSPEEQNKIIANEFRGATAQERTAKILNLCKIKGKTNKDGSPITASQVEKNSLETQIAFIEQLLNMPDAFSEELPLS